MTITDLKRIVEEQYGSLTPDDIDLLAKDAPNVVLVVKVGYGPRFATTAGKLDEAVQSNISLYKSQGLDQWVRDVFIPATDLDLLKQVLGWR